MWGSIRGTLEEGRGRTAEGFRDLDALVANLLGFAFQRRYECGTHKPFATAVWAPQAFGITSCG